VTEAPQFKRITMARTGGTAVVALASDKVNALDPEVLRELGDVVGVCEEDPGIVALVVTGEGSIFSAGLNVTEVLAHDAAYTAGLLDTLHETLVRIFSCPLPTVAAVNGPAIAGGCLLACAFDQRLIAEEARMGVTELKVGVSFPTVAVELLKHACGRRAEGLMFDARLLPAEEACRVGLAHRSVPRSELLEVAVSTAEQLASLDPRAYALAKASVRRDVLAAIEGEAGRLLDRQVREQWQDDRTRANLELLLKPKA